MLTEQTSNQTIRPRLASWIGIATEQARTHRHATLVVSALVMLVLTVVARFETLTMVQPDHDEGAYVVMAQTLRTGGMLYVDAWDNKPPGIYLIYAAAMSLAPDPIIGIRAAAIAAVWLTSLCLLLVLNLAGRSQVPGIAAGILYLLYTRNNGGLAANTEIFLNLFTASGFLCVAVMLFGKSRHPFIWSTLAGLVFGLAVQIKPIAAFETLAALVLIIIASEGRIGLALKVAAAFIGASMLPTAATFATFWLAGVWEAYAHANFTTNLTRAGELSPSWIKPLLFYKWQFSLEARQPILWIGALVAAPWLLLHQRPEKLSRLLVWLGFLWLIASVAGLVAQKTYFTHAFLTSVPALALLGGWAIAPLIRFDRRWRPVGIAATLLLLLPMLNDLATGSYKAIDRHDPAYALAEMLRDMGMTDQRVWLLGPPAMIYAMADIRPAGPYVGFPGWMFDPKATELGWLDGPAEIQHIVENPPSAVVVSEPWRLRIEDAQEPILAMIRKWLVDRYVATDHINGHTIYVRTSNDQGSTEP